MKAEARSVDDAARFLVAFAKASGNDSVIFYVRADGRVELSGTSGVFVDWTVRGDLADGSADPPPSVALGNIQRRPR